MQNLVTLSSKFLQDESGQGTVEYILLLSVVVIAASHFARVMINAFDTVVLVIGGQLERDLKTGRLGPGAWNN